MSPKDELDAHHRGYFCRTVLRDDGTKDERSDLPVLFIVIELEDSSEFFTYSMEEEC